MKIRGHIIWKSCWISHKKLFFSRRSWRFFSPQHRPRKSLATAWQSEASHVHGVHRGRGGTGRDWWGEPNSSNPKEVHVLVGIKHHCTGNSHLLDLVGIAFKRVCVCSFFFAATWSSTSFNLKRFLGSLSQMTLSLSLSAPSLPLSLSFIKHIRKMAHTEVPAQSSPYVWNMCPQWLRHLHLCGSTPGLPRNLGSSKR